MRSNVTHWWQPDNPFTVTGRVLFLSLLVALLFLIKTEIAPLWVYLATFMALTFIVGLLFRTHLAIKPLAVPLTSRGEPFVLPLRIDNLRRLDAFDLQVDVIVPGQGYTVLNPQLSISGIARNGSLVIELKCQAVHRGVFALPRIRIASLFPFGLFRFFQIVEPNGTIEIAPAIATSLRIDEAQSHDDQLEHAASFKASLLLNDYVGSREYQTGMSVRRWDFASWARLGKPAVREFAGHSDTLLVIVVDTTFHGPKGSVDDELERVLSAAGGLVHQFDDSRLSIEMVLVDDWLAASQADGLNVLETEHEGLSRLARVRGTQQAIDWNMFFRWLAAVTPQDAVVLAICRSDKDQGLQQIVHAPELSQHPVHLVYARHS